MQNPAMKYIIIGDEEGYEFPILFPTYWGHDEIARNVVEKRQWVLAAGFVRIGDGGEFVCLGGSRSLGIAARPERDAKVISTWMTTRA